MTTPAAPRRERNRQATWDAIHGAAVGLVLSDGLAGTTADSIAESAAVSRRTFFNYFATKEDAVLGTRAPRLSGDDLAAFAAAPDSRSPDDFGRVVRLMTAAVRSVFQDLPTFTLEHRVLLKRHPELLARIDVHVREAEGLVRGVLADRASDDPAPRDSDRALVLMAGAVMRFAFAPDADGVIHDSPQTVDAAIERFRSLL
jgi:AcrR family transcriptional regulator